MRLTQAMVSGAKGAKAALEVVPDDFRAVTTEDIIDGFLSVGDYRITPDDDAQQEDMTSQIVDNHEEIISEELAEIYLKQGLAQQAQEIYDKLKRTE